MTAPEKPGTAVAKREDRLESALLSIAQTPEERAAAYRALERIRQDRMVRAAAEQIASESWGKALSPHSRAAVARYALELGVDPVRHLEVLGGRIYDTAALWLDRCASEPDYQGETHEYIHDDERLSAEERAERKRQRAIHGVPEGVKGACVVTIHRAGKMAATGVNWAGSLPPHRKDPVGDAEPSKTAFTRAFRRAARTIYPLWFRGNHLPTADEGVRVEGMQVALGAQLQAEHRAASLPAPEPARVEPPADPYGEPGDPWDGGEDEDRRVRDEDARLL